MSLAGQMLRWSEDEMRPFTKIAVAAVTALSMSPVLAHPPTELESFVGAKAGQAEMGLQNLGYDNARTKGLTSYWWNADEAVCVAIVTKGGRYKTIDIVKPAQCGKKVVAGGTEAGPTVMSMQDIPRFCKGEASARFGVRPNRITTNMAFKSGNRYVSQGWYDNDGGTKFFNCWFDRDGSFLFVS
jgi:hypothetical protein